MIDLLRELRGFALGVLGPAVVFAGGLVGQQPQVQVRGTDAAALATRTVAELRRLQRQHAVRWRELEAARVGARRAEQNAGSRRQGAPSQSRAETATAEPWIRLAGFRSAIHDAAVGIVTRHDRRLAEISRGPGADARATAESTLRTVAAWVDVDSPVAVRGVLAADLPAIRGALGAQLVADSRRRFLARVADGLCRLPGRSDLEDLSELLEWVALFHAKESVGGRQLGAATADLIVVLTERDTAGVRNSKFDYYRSGRFLDAGFGRDLRDGSDQVRHFIWALRAMVLSPSFATTEQILKLKELRDAATRGAAVEKADLALNQRAREVAEIMRGKRGAKSRKPGVPLSIERLPALVRSVLGRSPPKRVPEPAKAPRP